MPNQPFIDTRETRNPLRHSIFVQPETPYRAKEIRWNPLRWLLAFAQYFWSKRKAEPLYEDAATYGKVIQMTASKKQFTYAEGTSDVHFRLQKVFPGRQDGDRSKEYTTCTVSLKDDAVNRVQT